MIINCKNCNNQLTIIDLDVMNNSNDYGEDFYTYSLYCDCGNTLKEGSGWGDCYGEDKQELWEELLVVLK